MRVFTFLLAAGVLLLAACKPAPTKPAKTMAPVPMDTIRGKDGALMVKIPAGEFLMGSPAGQGNKDEQPFHRVYLDAYYVDVCEVTNRQYRAFCDATGRPYPKKPDFQGIENYFLDYPDYPVVEVTWDDAEAYAAWAGKRVPTEAEWEKAARGTDGRDYPWGNEAVDATRCNYADKAYSTLPGATWADRQQQDGFVYAAPTGNFPAGVSPYGVLDMAGNVWEMCTDGYQADYYTRSPARNPTGPKERLKRVIRGGAFTSTRNSVRCAARLAQTNLSPMLDRGFRCVQSAAGSR